MDVKKLVEQMTLEEKASLCSGADFWHTKAVERLDIPKMMVSDGPHGLRKQDQHGDHLGMNESIQAVCFPAGSAMAASFDRDLIYRIGEVIGNECQAENLGVVLGPAMNIKRSPLCGRNFEYFSEDPYLAGEIAASHVKGVQSKHVGTSPKHFLANNQEHRRMSSDAVVDERTLREIYLPAFEKVVKEAKPWTVMCSYNSVNGTYASENHWALTEVLRDEWGFDGFVVSDWGAVNDRVKALQAGLDLEMPASGGLNDAKIVKAVQDGTLDEAVLDQTVERILEIVYRYAQNRDEQAVWDKEKDHAFAREAAAECMVLLKNEHQLLPLDKADEVAFIGAFAEKPRYQGGGSSHINSFRTESVLEAADGKYEIRYAKGYSLEDDQPDEALIKEAVETAKTTWAAVIFAGLPDSYESEGYDRTHMKLPPAQDELIRRVAEVNPNTVVVLHNGSPIEMPWADDVKSILEVYLGGQAVGAATLDVLVGEKNPGGRLPETFPVKVEDNPSWLYYGGEGDCAEYREGVFVGYRYYDKKKLPVRYPFGHGLSYTTFWYTHPVLSTDSMLDTDTLTVTVNVENIGKREGDEVVQLYVAPKTEGIIRPEKELKGFEKIHLRPGEKKTVTFTLDRRAFAYWNTQIHDWHVLSGTYEIQIGKSSRDIIYSNPVEIQSTVKIPVQYDENSLFGDVCRDPEGKEVLEPYMDMIRKGMGMDEEASGAANEAISEDMMMAMLQYMPLRGVRSFCGDQMTEENLQGLIEKLNGIGK